MESSKSIGLVIMAAGQGSRFGGPKQFVGVGPDGEFLLDYSIKYAVQQAVSDVCIVTNSEYEHLLNAHLSKFHAGVKFTLVYQDVFTNALACDRRLYGTGVALMAAISEMEGDFILVNGDDYYSRHAFEIVLRTLRDSQNVKGCLAGYELASTLSEHGSVSRAVCSINGENSLAGITEFLSLRKLSGSVVCDQSGKEFSGKELVSMNFWGFRSEFCEFVKDRFNEYVNSPEKVQTSEFGIPDVVKTYILDRPGSFLVCPLSESEWIGMTYPEDLEKVRNFLKMI